MDLHLELIEHPKALQKLCDRLSGHSHIAVDTEFIREKTYFPELALIQIATDREGWLVDALALTPKELQPLLEILMSQEVLKILHSAYGDQECFYFTYGITVKPTLDTFEAASLLGFGESVGLRDLIHKALQIKIPKFLTRTNWLVRPINEEMKLYALADVQYLVDIGKNLIKELDKTERKEWAFELSQQWEDPKVYEPNPVLLAQRFAKSGKIAGRNFPIFHDLVEWREDRAKKINIPRRRVCDDETLMNIANSRPKHVDQLRKFRGIQAAEVNRQGKILLEIIQRDRSQKHYDFPPPPRIAKSTSQQSRTIDFLSTYLKAICQNLKIASRLIFTVKDLQRIVQDNILDPEQWVRLGLLSSQGCRLVGDELLEALQGKRGLAIDKGQLKILKL